MTAEAQLGFFGIALLLVMFYWFDARNFNSQPEDDRRTALLPDTVILTGTQNLFFILVILAAAFVNKPPLLREGLMIAAAIVLAYVVRFFGIAQGALDSSFGRISPSLPLAARSLGRSAGGTLSAVYLPLMRGSVATALLVVFVDCVKELPATLLLRPFNFNTLSTRVYELVSLEHLGEASPAALVVVAMGLAAVALLARANR